MKGKGDVAPRSGPFPGSNIPAVSKHRDLNAETTEGGPQKPLRHDLPDLEWLWASLPNKVFCCKKLNAGKPEVLVS